MIIYIVKFLKHFSGILACVLLICGSIPNVYTSEIDRQNQPLLAIWPECTFTLQSGAFKVVFSGQNLSESPLTLSIISSDSSAGMSLPQGIWPHSSFLVLRHTQNLTITDNVGNSYTLPVNPESLKTCRASQYFATFNNSQSHKVAVIQSTASDTSIALKNGTFITPISRNSDLQSLLEDNSTISFIPVEERKRHSLGSINSLKLDSLLLTNDTYRTKSVTSIIIDDGVDYSHPQLLNSVVAEGCFNVSIPNGYDSTCPMGTFFSDEIGSGLPCKSNTCTHGTMVAGILGGRDIGFGIKGVNPRVNIASFQVFTTQINCPETSINCEYTDDLNLLQAYNYAVRLVKQRPDLHITTINTSIGGGSFEGPCDTEFWGAQYYNVFQELKDLGVYSVVATGNGSSPTRVSLPSCVSNAISVGSLNRFGNVAQFSNRGISTDLFAPGEELTTLLPNNGYAIVSGTSFSAPIVAGLLSLSSEIPLEETTELDNMIIRSGNPFTDGANNLAYRSVNGCNFYKQLGYESCSQRAQDWRYDSRFILFLKREVE